MITVPADRSAELDQYEPLYKSKSLGFVSGLLPSTVEIPEAQYARPGLAEIFLALTGGFDASI